MLSSEQISESTVVTVETGPMGLCALTAAANFKPNHLFAVNSGRVDLISQESLERTIELPSLKAKIRERIKRFTDRRRTDVVTEVVGFISCLKSLGGLISSLGVRIGKVTPRNYAVPHPLIHHIQWISNEAYGKNLRPQIVRCPVRSIFPEALNPLENNNIYSRKRVACGYLRRLLTSHGLMFEVIMTQ